MLVMSHRAEHDAVIVETSTGQLKIQVLNPHIMRVVFTGRPEFSTATSLMVLPGLEVSAPRVAETAEDLVLSTAQLRLQIDKTSGAFTWTDDAGRLLVREPHDGADTKTLQPIDVVRSIFDQDTEITTTLGADGAKSNTGHTHTVVDRQAYSTKLRLEFETGEAIYGLGQHEEGILNYRGHHQHLYQQNMKVAAPVLVSTRGYGLLWDSQSLASFYDDQDGTYFWTEVDDEMDFYMIVGPELDDIVGHIRELTGQAPMLPRWSLGYLQSKDRYTDAAELVDVVAEHRRRHIPLDCIVQDWQSWPEGQWGQKSFDPTRYPDPAQLCTDLHQLHARLMVSIWPNMHGDGPNQLEMRDTGHLLGDGSTYDAFDANARALYWRQMNDGYFHHGVDAWWADCTEPFEGDWKGTVEPEPWQRLLINTAELKKYLDPERINAYSLLHSQGLYEGQRATGNGKRVFLLTRSGSIGQQRYGSVTWSGDHSATWATLRRQIADGLNFCITGNPNWTFDIGAYFVSEGKEWFWRGDFDLGSADLGYRELYVRWLQLGAFLPIFRSHGRDTAREPWRFGEPGDATYDTIVAFIKLRYRLLPYLYSLHGWTAHRAYTPMRALAFDFRHDPDVFDVDDEFMLGPSLLICPVTEPIHFGPGSAPLDHGCRTRQVYLPRGCDWYDFWTGRRHEGGQTIDADAPLETMPIFVRAGTILPLGPEVEHTGENPDGPLEIRIYAGADGAFDLYDDEGDGYGYEHGEFTFTSLRWSDQSQRLVVGDRTGSFPGVPAERILQPVLVSEGTGIGAEPSVGAEYAYGGTRLEITSLG